MDDRDDNLLSMEVVLEKDDYSFIKARSGTEALKVLLKDENFSLILLDVKMPGLNGYETAELIYQRDKLKDIPIIFITAHDHGVDSMFKGYKAGAVDYIGKPFHPEILRSKVAVFADLYRKKQLLKEQELELKIINNDLLQLNQELDLRVKKRTIELENLNQELKELNLSKDKIVSVISHDLRNPIAALIGSAEMLNLNLDGLDMNAIKKLSKIIHRNAVNILRQLNELVEQCMQQNKIKSFNPQKLQLLYKVNESLELLKTNAVQKNIILLSNIPEEVYVNADAVMLRSIIQNLITNSIKYTSPGGSVTITAQVVEGMVEVYVKDTGIGIAPEIKERLFTNFASFPSEGTNKEHGNGLGLFLVKDFVSQHGGSIHIESEVGQGTVFKFTLPAIKDLVIPVRQSLY